MYKLKGNFHSGKFSLEVKDLYPMNMGSSVYTEYEFNEDFIGYRMDNPNSLDWELGHCHSHQTMPTFFSGTDTKELQDNAPNHNYYLSLIVNNALQMTAKLAFVGEQEVRESVVRSFTGDNGKLYNLRSNQVKKEEVLFVYNCDIILDYKINVQETFEKRVDQIINEYINKQKTFTNPKVFKSNIPYQPELPFTEYPYNVDYMDDDDNVSHGKKDRNTKILEKFLADALMQEYGSNKSIEEAIFSGLQDYKQDKDKFIFHFGAFIRSMDVMYYESNIDITKDIDTLNSLQEILLDYQDGQFEDFIEDLIVELEFENL